MIDSTGIVMGPGGVGKSPLDALFKNGVLRLDPYRLRQDGPKKDRDDLFYAHPQLRQRLQLIFALHGDAPRRVASGVEWFPISGEGTLLSFTKATFAPKGFEKDVPYRLGVAEFSDDMKVFGRMDGSLSDDEVKAGMKIKIRTVDLGDERFSYELTAA